MIKKTVYFGWMLALLGLVVFAGWSLQVQAAGAAPPADEVPLYNGPLYNGEMFVSGRVSSECNVYEYCVV